MLTINDDIAIADALRTVALTANAYAANIVLPNNEAVQEILVDALADAVELLDRVKIRIDDRINADAEIAVPDEDDDILPF